MADDPEPEDAIESQRLQAEFEQSCLDYGEAIKEGRHEDAEEIAMKVMQLSILRSMTEEPSPTLAWMQMASECEEQGNWAAAIDAHQHAIAAARAEANPAFAMKPHLDLAGLYDILGRGPEAMSQIDAAVELVKDN
jgi:tetratricopeptide (TPR) repeat protein